MLQEFYRPHFHRGRVEDVALLDQSLRAWVVDYNSERPNNGDYMAGRTPLQVKKELSAASGRLLPDRPVKQKPEMSTYHPNPVLRKD